MLSADGRLVIVFNGEIYNHGALREQLAAEGQAPPWRGHSDTETLLAAIAAWGVTAAVKACVGMFAFAVFDRESRQLTLARDRLGEKPLYYGLLRGALCLGSELKALRAVDRGALRWHNGAVAAFMRLGYVPGPQSIYEGVWRLAPGTLLTIGPDDIARGRLPAPQAYWRALDLPGQPLEPVDDAAALDRMDAVLREAVKGQMLSSDVPLGALLSGGVDSSLIVALMQAQSSRPVRTFSIGFADSSSDEAPYARAVAAHLGTEHTELYVTAQDTLNTVPRLPEVYCEPFADSSQVPTLLVSALARRHVTVALSGDGGDELFAGYDRYQRVAQDFGRVAAVPRALRAAAGAALKHTPLGLLDGLAHLAGNPGGAPNPADRLRKIGALLGSADAAAFNRGLVTLWEPKWLMPRVAELPSVYSGALPPAGSLVEQLMLADTQCYLPDDLLVKVDRAAMATSLEVRAPFLDHRVVEQAWRMDASYKLRGGQRKWLLQALLARYLPRPLFERPKQGFGLPVDGWLQGPLRDWAESLLSAAALSRDGLFDVAVVRRRWHEQLGGRRNWQQALWCVLMFQAWAEHTRR